MLLRCVSEAFADEKNVLLHCPSGDLLNSIVLTNFSLVEQRTLGFTDSLHHFGEICEICEREKK